MENQNTRQYTTNELIDKLTEIGLLTENEARAYVYSVIMDDDSADDRMSRLTESEIKEVLNRAKDKISSVKKTIEVLTKSYDSPVMEIDLLIGAGLLDERQAESYVHYRRSGMTADNLTDTLERSPEAIQREIEVAEEKVKKAKETVGFLVADTGIQKRP